MAHRVEKLESLIQNELSLIFLHKLQDPELGLLTITRVKLTSDLKIAKVYFSVFEREKREEVLEKVEDLKGHIRTMLAGKVRMKYIPELQFYIDDSLDHVERIEGLLKELNEDDNRKNERSEGY